MKGNDTQHWDEEVDLAVVGYGGAGAAAAITACDMGGDVLVLEKQPANAHTSSTSMSGGIIMGVNDVERATRYLNTCAAGLVPAEVSRALTARAGRIVDWVNSLMPDYRVQASGQVGEYPQFEGAEAVGAYDSGRLGPDGNNLSPAGFALFEALDYATKRRPIDVRYGAPARRLVQASDGRVIGVEYQDGDAIRRVRARRAVLLSCGGYEFNEEMKRDFLKAHPTYFYGNPGNTGDGVVMAQAVGASLWHMNLMMGRGIGRFSTPDGRDLNFPIAIDSSTLRNGSAPAGYVITDKYGRRFTSELPQARMGHSFYFHMLPYDPEREEYPRIPSYWFFDERRRTAGPLTRPSMGAVRVGMYDWSADNSTEIARGWIERGDTLRAAAAAAGIAEPDEAAKTIETYNQACQSGMPDPLGRPAETMVPLDSPPYYCVPLWPGGPNTSGGPRRNEHAQILDAFGDPIPGLYGAGELGQAAGTYYPCAGMCLTEALCFGQIAAEHAMRDETKSVG